MNHESNKTYQFTAYDNKGHLLIRSKSSQNIMPKDSPPSPLSPRNDFHSGMQIYQNFYRESKSRGSAGSIGTYDTVYVRERRRGVDFSRDIRNSDTFQLDGARNDNNSA